MKKFIDIENNKCNFNDKEIYFIIDEKNNPWFKGKDVANILEYNDTKQAIRWNIDEDDKEILENIGGVYNTPLERNEKKNLLFIDIVTKRTDFSSIITELK